MIKKFNDFLNESNSKLESRLPVTKVDIDPQEIVERLRSGKIKIDFRLPDNAKQPTQSFIDSELDSIARTMEHRIEYYGKKKYKYEINELPFDLDYHYDHPINGVYCDYVLVSMDKITLATLESDGKDFYYSELPIPDTLIEGDFYTCELDVPSGKMCFCGDWVRDIFVEKEWTDMKYGNHYHRVESDAIKHMEHFLKQGYFFVPDAFYPTLSKKDDTYYLYRGNGEAYDENLGKVISDRLQIDSDHTMVIIDGDVLDKKLKENKKEYDKLTSFDKKYLKYSLKVSPGKYQIQFNWRFGMEDEDGSLVYFIIKKI